MPGYARILRIHRSQRFFASRCGGRGLCSLRHPLELAVAPCRQLRLDYGHWWRILPSRMRERTANGFAAKAELARLSTYLTNSDGDNYGTSQTLPHLRGTFIMYERAAPVHAVRAELAIDGRNGDGHRRG